MPLTILLFETIWSTLLFTDKYKIMYVDNYK